MSVCTVCGKVNQHAQCDDCLARYREDMRTGHIPPKFLEADVDFEFMDWVYVKEEEAYCARERMSPEEARSHVAAACSMRVHCRLSQAATPAQAKREADERIKRYSTY